MVDIKKYIRSKLEEYILEKKLKPQDIKIIIERPKDEGNGDYSTSLAMILSKQLKRNPKQIAEEIRDFILKQQDGKNYISESKSAGPGFLNMWISDDYYKNVIGFILEEEDSYGKLEINKGKTANLEWVSANPTGPLHAGHGRHIALGKAAASLLEWSGFEVTREYYYNDAGKQMENLSKSVYARYRQIFDEKYPFPEDGYVGDYVIKIAELIRNEYSDKLLNQPENEIFKTAGENYCFKSIKHTLDRLGIHHDVFFNETSLYETRKIKETLEEFKKKGLSYEKDGAVWLKISELIKNKKDPEDKVIVKSSGEPTYRMPDMAYHVDKIKRGYELIVDIFGADHGDTYKEVIAGVEGLGYDTSKIKVIIHQMVTFVQDGKPVKMSKRSDNVYYLDDLLDDVGEDVAQFFFVMRSANTHLDFDIKLAKEQSEKNPV
ncbi:MAG TPA: arginine--tRNA ligase, partial [Ignavibacteria bacterium]